MGFLRGYLAFLFACIATTTAFTIPQHAFSDDAQYFIPNDNTVEINPCTLIDSPSSNASVQLSSWLQCQVNAFYPYPENGDWPTAHASAFSPTVHFSFNDTTYDYPGSLELYKRFNASLGAAFAPFKHHFSTVLAVPSPAGNKGGWVYLTGWSGGWHRKAARELWWSNAAFVVVKEVAGLRKIVEFRESSNLPSRGGMPEGKDLVCRFA